MSTVATAWIGEPYRSAVPPWGRSAHAPEPVVPIRPAVNDSAVSHLVGQNLRRLRKQHRLSLEALAGQSGVSRAMLGQIEQGKSIPSIKTLWQVAQSLGVSVSWFLESSRESAVFLITPPDDSAEVLSRGEGELRSLQRAGDAVRDAFYELRLAPGAVLSLPATTVSRRVNVAVSTGQLSVEVDDITHRVQEREVLQYETLDGLVWRNDGDVDVQAFVLIKAAPRRD